MLPCARRARRARSRSGPFPWAAPYSIPRRVPSMLQRRRLGTVPHSFLRNGNPRTDTHWIRACAAWTQMSCAYPHGRSAGYGCAWDFCFFGKRPQFALLLMLMREPALELFFRSCSVRFFPTRFLCRPWRVKPTGRLITCSPISSAHPATRIRWGQAERPCPAKLRVCRRLFGAIQGVRPGVYLTNPGCR